MENQMDDNEFLIRWNGSSASGSADFGTSLGDSLRNFSRAIPVDRQPSAAGLEKARAKMAADNASVGWAKYSVEWREGDHVFTVNPVDTGVLALFWPLPVTENIEGKMAAARSWCSPEELAAMDRIADGEPPGPLDAEVEGLRKKLAVLEKKEANRELAEMDDILRGGDGNLPQSNEQVIARILGDSASYGQVLRIAKLLDRTETFAVDGLKRELEDAKKQITEMKRLHSLALARAADEIVRLREEQKAP